MSKKVLIITQNFYPVIGSAGNRLKNIFQLLNNNNIETSVLTTEPAYPNKNLYRDNAFWDDKNLNDETEKIIRVPIKNKRFSNNIISRLIFYLEMMYRFLVTLWKYRKENYDFLFVSTPPIFIVFSAFIGRFFLKSKLILEVRDLWPDSLTGVKAFNYPLIIKLFQFLEKRMYQMADYIVINSEGFEEHIQSKLKEKKSIIYLPNGPRINEIVKNKDNLQSDGFKVVYTGNLGLAQDVDQLKSIASILHDKEIRFDIIGYGVKTQELAQYIEENSLKNVHLKRPTTRKRSLELIKNSDVAVAFLNDEDVFSTVLPGKIIDYMTCGTPIVAGVKGTAAQTIKKYDVGFAFDQKDVQGMVAKIDELRGNIEELKRIGANGVKTVEKDFLWEKNIGKLVHLIKE